jgi:hypothetical protein
MESGYFTLSDNHYDNNPRTPNRFGSPARITETLKKVEAAGFAEVICYFNVGLKPHNQVKDEMARFMPELAPAFEGKHKQRTAA